MARVQPRPFRLRRSREVTGAEAAAMVCSGSKCEKLNASKFSPLSPTERTSRETSILNYEEVLLRRKSSADFSDPGGHYGHTDTVDAAGAIVQTASACDQIALAAR